MLQHKQWTYFILLFLIYGFLEVHSQDEIVSKHRDLTAELICPIDLIECGPVHSIRWTKGDGGRVAMVSGEGKPIGVLGTYNERFYVNHTEGAPSTILKIKRVQVKDEGVYGCSIAYYSPKDKCDNRKAYYIELKVLVPPSKIEVFNETRIPLQNGTIEHLFTEGDHFKIICLVLSTRPMPVVEWYRGDEKLKSDLTVDEARGLYSAESKLSLTLSRQELGKRIECRVSSSALDYPAVHSVNLNLNVRPKKLEILDVKQNVRAGDNVGLICRVFSARPVANATWYNNSIPITPDNRTIITTKHVTEKDSSVTLFSQLNFTASRFENGVSFKCDADNVVMRDENEKTMHESILLEVIYPPVVYVYPYSHTVNESDEVKLNCNYQSNPATLKQVTWLKDGRQVTIEPDRMSGGETEIISLVIRNVSRTDRGSYRCELENYYGIGASEREIAVDVLFAPTVKLTMSPDHPVIEDNAENVTLRCEVIAGNPQVLDKVFWYLDGGLLKELPDCSNPALCEVDPDVLILENVGRTFLGNYSCQGMNKAGVGPRSADNDLHVYYEPGNATIVHYPLIATKHKSITFYCSIDDGGNPNATKYSWFQAGKKLSFDTPMITLDNIGLHSRTNFTCYAFNEAGHGIPSTIDLDVRAAPAFIQELPNRTAANSISRNIGFACLVECVPACSIAWFKNGNGIEREDDSYTITESYLPANSDSGHLESVFSQLEFNMDNWPGGKLNVSVDNANYSCVSTPNTEGPGVRSATEFRVQYPPANLIVSPAKINVIEGLSPSRITCYGDAYPTLKYEWFKKNKNGKNISISTGQVLDITKNMTRDDGGDYYCVAKNLLGTETATVTIDVHYKPNCTINRKERDGKDTLICDAIGNPAITFNWSVVNDTDDSLEDNHSYNCSESDGTVSNCLNLDDDYSIVRVYQCEVNNSVGVGMCEIEVTEKLSWWERIGGRTIIIIVAVVAALLLLVIIICCIIICICRKLRRRDKSHEKSSAAADPLTEPGEYENLPFHGLQSAPNKPLCADNFSDDLEYADVDFNTYGPINYKAASVYALLKKGKNGTMKEVKK